ncbi:hypothetical protein [Rubellimicrobium aerolatum]|uniref:Uncharacterized protein n=1 Tax=Rubellimicrobium aerolatum TaxID=490979 RepID=A0ABW0SCL3_9RHOB|nr:hypothetical protein [Rubellimicrobium aerolatum]MBP1806178.1 hypothetical protein [Rubellimicrobium aerolatum]
MTDDPVLPVPPRPGVARRGVRDADVPSETHAQGLPDVGEGASATHLGRDVPLGLQAGEDEGDDGESGDPGARTG